MSVRPVGVFDASRHAGTGFATLRWQERRCRSGRKCGSGGRGRARLGRRACGHGHAGGSGGLAGDEGERRQGGGGPAEMAHRNSSVARVYDGEGARRHA
ncbi:MAG: hypothetical protein EPO16_08745 [Dehalococcoidia bacterium]|nr:MAG: hypothetical protein EPO16_08745 [Dehalococcoidia bacterium]